MIKIIDSYYQCVFNLYKDIVCVSSESYEKDGIDKVCEMIKDFGIQNGFAAQIVKHKEAGNELVLTYNEKNDGPITVFLAHMDTVHKKGAFEKMFKEEGNMVYGPGVHDCKGGIAVALLTCMALKASGYKNPLRIVLACDEEISMVLSKEKGTQFIIDNVKDAARVFTCESGIKDKMIVGRKGSARYKITIHGKAAHSGANYDEGVSAIKAACLMIPEIEKVSNSENMTFNCGLIKGGKAPNIIPDLCEFIVDTRYPDMNGMEESERHIYNVVSSNLPEGITTEIEVISKRIPMEATEGNYKLFERVKRISKELGYEDFVSFVSGGASDAAFPAAMGIPTLCGTGIVGKNQHTLNEMADLSSIKTRSHLFVKTIVSLDRKGLSTEDYNEQL